VQYMALIYSDQEQWAALSDDERQGMYARYQALSQDAQEAGVMAGGNELAPTRDATTVRVRADETLVTDGPYAEVKEALGGYFLFEWKFGRSTSIPRRCSCELRDAHLRRRLGVGGPLR